MAKGKFPGGLPSGPTKGPDKDTKNPLIKKDQKQKGALKKKKKGVPAGAKGSPPYFGRG